METESKNIGDKRMQVSESEVEFFLAFAPQVYQNLCSKPLIRL